MKKIQKLVICAAVLSFCGLAAGNALALTKGFEALSFRPAADSGPYFMVWGTKNLNPGQWTAGTYVTYAYHPFQLTAAGVRVRGIHDNTIVEHFYASAGIFKWLQAGFEIPLGWWVQFTDPNIAAATRQNKVIQGDIAFELKAEIVDVMKHRVGLALVPFITAPTGRGSYYFGNGGVTGGGKLALEFLPIDRFSIALNAGIQARERFTFRNIDKPNQLLLNLGAAVKATDNLSVAAEINSQTRLSGPFKTKSEAPTEAIAGIKYAIGDSGFTVSGGGGAGIVRGTSAPTFRGFAAFSYKSMKKEKPVAKEEAKPSYDFIDSVVVLFGFSKSRIKPEAAADLAKVAAAMKETPELKVKVTGYTDSTGREKCNWKLSSKRARMAKTRLVKQGVAASRIETVGRDSLDPRETNKTREGRAANRRVEFKLVR